MNIQNKVRLCRGNKKQSYDRRRFMWNQRINRILIFTDLKLLLLLKQASE